MIIKKFEDQVEQFAGNTAIITETKKLTYEELNNHANGTALAIQNHLSTSAKNKEHHVLGLLFEHSADMIVGVLGTLKAGKIYVPLDITYPENRLVYMLEDSGTHLVLTNTDNLFLAEKLVKKVTYDLPVINIDTIDNTVTYPGIERTPSADKPAYILYTSGSTGKPKGVLQDHKNVCYYIDNWAERFSITPGDRMTLFSAFSHDGAGQDMFGALHNGAALYPYNILNRSNIAELPQWLIDEKITIWHSVPTLYRYFVEILKDRDIGPREFPYLRFILLGGEQIREHDIEMFKRFFPHAKFANVYGQTESSVDSVWIINAGDTINKMLIGDPLDKTGLLIVDKEGTVVEDMGVGEIVVSCPHLALGYWNDKQSSERVFFHDPDLGPLYRTGDLGRLLADGSIEMMGRKDTQVKIRGFRVEVGEVETTLLNHPFIKEAVVIARTDDRGNAHLYGYYVPEPSLAAPGKETVLNVPEIRKYLSGELPEHMIPSYYVELPQMPLTPNGKVDRKRLPEPESTRPQLGITYVAPGTDIEKQISDIWREILQLDKVGMDDNFFDLGGTSFDIMRITTKLYETYKREIPVISVFQHPTIRSFAAYFNRDRAGGGEKDEQGIKIHPVGGTWERPADIAVIGMSGQFPGAKNLDEFWENLKNGVESIGFFSDRELSGEPGANISMLDNPNYVKARGIVENIDYFDAGFFNYTPAEAEVMDPQLRMMHELSWEALENGGYDPGTYEGLIGLYAGNAANHHWIVLTLLNQKTEVDTGFLYNNYSTIVSYRLNLRGPSFILQCACSTSLVALHLACQGLKNGECDMALAGGVSIWLPNKDGYMYQQGMIHSRDGHCRTFDAGASGTVFGNGAGIVLLKPLEAAIAGGDHILAVIKGSGINNDGSRKIGLPSPSIEGQAEIIGKVYRDSGINPESIGYLEAHGTGTIMGDPVELEALKLAFKTNKRQYCRIGSVKTNIGHLNVAAGISGFIKVVLALNHGLIPPNLHFNIPNPRFDFEKSPFTINTAPEPWERGKIPLRAGISSFGIGGTNAHVVLEEAPPAQSSSTAPDIQMLLLSARTQSALQTASENLADYLKSSPHINLADVAYTLRAGRKPGQRRRMILCTGVEEAIDLLTSAENAAAPGQGKVRASVPEGSDRPVVFMFPGQGAQYVEMGRELYEKEPRFREEMDRCFEILKDLMEHDVKQVLYPHSDCRGGSPCPPHGEVSHFESGDSPGHNRSHSSHTSNITRKSYIEQTEIAQPLLFSFEYALAGLLMKWGIKPYALVGHSIGEYTAACLSGVFSLEEALGLVVLRGKLMQQMPAGSMLSVPLPEDRLKLLLAETNANAGAEDELSLAAVNTTAYCVVSGTHRAIAAFVGKLKEAGIESKRLHTSHAFHSVMMEPMLREFKEKAKGISFNKPVIPYISNLTGTWITVEEAENPGYWARHLRETVRFADGLTELLKEARTIFLEVGPGRGLATFVRQHKNKKPTQLNLNLVRHPKENVSDTYYLLGRIGRLWLNGGKINWRQFHAGERRLRVPLPTYPFEKKRYWLEGDFNNLAQRELSGEPRLKKQANLANWFHIPSWKTRTSAFPVIGGPDTFKAAGPCNWLVFMDECDIGARLVQELNSRGHYVMTARTGTGLVKTGDKQYTINPGQGEDYGALLEEYLAKGKIPTRILHLWNVTGNNEEPDPRRAQELGYYSLVYLAQALGKQSWNESIQISVITNQVQAVTGKEQLSPNKAPVLGAIQVIPREYPNIDCRCIDIEFSNHPGNPGNGDRIRHLLAELLSETRETMVAFRDNYRWIKSYEPLPLEAPGPGTPRLRPGGVYLVTGGLGGIGLVLAEYLAKTVKAKLVLTGRTPLPDRKEWGQWLNTHGPRDSIRQKIEGVLRLEAAAAEVLVLNADAADKARMQTAVDRARERFGKFNGVIHSAGVPDGGLIQRRTRDMSDRVFAPKITGTLVLDELLEGEELDFFVLCSSISAVTAPLGQVAYCAANTFMDSYANYKTIKQRKFTVSINWDAWREVGMAVEAVRKLSPVPAQGAPTPREREVDYPLFERCQAISPDRVVYNSSLRVDNCWFLDEHRIEGIATIPGTGYLEMARAAVEHHTGCTAIELRDFYYLAFLIVRENEEKEIRILLEKNGNEYTFSLISQVNPGEDKWEEHARGKVLCINNQKSRHYALKEIETACDEGEIVYHREDYAPEQGAMTFGPRWNNLRRVKSGNGQALGVLELPGEFTADIGTYKLHPALLDVGNLVLRQNERTGKEKSFYAPVFYKRLTIKGELPQKTLFHVKAVTGNELDAETLRYNIVIMDEQGNELVEIEEYTLRKLRGDERTVKQYKDRSGETAAPRAISDNARPYASFVTPGEPGNGDATGILGNDPLKDAISPREGIEIFRRVLGGGGWPQVVVSTIDLRHRLEQEHPLTRREAGARETGGITPKQARPELSSEYAAPVTGIEKRLAPIWENLLGIEQVGIYDDFFELGGDSLKAVNFAAHIHKELNTEVPISEFFNRPNIKELAQYIEKNNEISQYYSIQPVEKKEYYPLSPAQQRLYIIDRMTPGQVAYNIPLAMPLPAGTGVDRLEEIFNRIIARHGSLRTSFLTVKEEVVQRVRRTVTFKIEERRTVEGFIRPFDLSRGPLLRVALVPAHLLVDMHHIISDGTSYGILRREMAELHGGRGGESTPLRLQYVDYCQWLNRPEQQRKRERQGAYWMEVFSGQLPTLDLPLDFPRPQNRSFDGGTVTFTLEAADTGRLKNTPGGAASENEITLYMKLLCIFNILMHKLGGGEDIVVGTPVTARRHPDLRDMVGMFVNTLPMRLYPQGHKRLRYFLEEVKEHTMEAYGSREYPLEDLVDRMAGPRDPGRNPLFDVMLNLLNQAEYPTDIPQPGDAGKGDEKEAPPVKNITSKFDLNMTCVDLGERLFFDLEYCSRLFKRETVIRFVDYFRRTVRWVSDPANREKRLRELEIIGEKEKERLLSQFNDTAIIFPSGKTVHGLFGEQLAQTPDCIALVGFKAEGEKEEVCLTYRELNERAGRLARQLKEKGVGPDVLVGLLVGRSLELVTGILGILKAGGGYLPIDPAQPGARKNYIIQDSGVTVVLAADQCTAGGGENPPAEHAPGNHPRSAANDGSLAYMLYTSGSTGRPKGVLLEHRGLVNLLLWTTDCSGMDCRSVLQYASPGFDVSFHEIFSAFSRGGKLCAVADERRTDIPRLLGFIEKHLVRTVFLPMALLKVIFNETGYRGRFPACVRHIQTAGEQVVISDNFRNYLTKEGIYVHNHYGPSETHVVTALTLGPADRIPALPSIGKPVANTGIYILDRYDNIQPLGVAGELCISGVQVGRGYLNRPELTNEKFLRGGPGGAVFSKSAPPGRRRQKLYKTGDLGRWLEDGNIEFLGRMDHQVKLRGFRIELGEIETQLMDHPGIREAVVLLKDAGDKYLCAYVVPAGKDGVGGTDLKDYLSLRLPHYMVPAVFVTMDRIPVTPNGKVDRAKLLAYAPPAGPSTGKTAPAVPGSGVEQLVAGVWRQVLGRQEPGPDDNFFEVGGNSISIIKVHARLTRMTGIDFPSVKLFKYATIRTMARYLEDLGFVEPGTVKGAPSKQETGLKHWDKIREGKDRMKSGVSRGLEIAIIGMSGVFPGAVDLGELWENLKSGVECISFFSDDELRASGAAEETFGAEAYARGQGVVVDPECFDADFFGYTPREAQIMDPQTRLFHQCVWHCLEDGGHDPHTYEGRIGLYAGASFNLLWHAAVFSGLLPSPGVFQSGLLVDKDFLCAHISYKLGLKGPSYSVQTACSTSLTAVHLAVQALLVGECEMALAGGVKLNFPTKSGYMYQEGMILSPDGHCRTFDAGAVGTVPGSGAAVVLLKPLDRAEADGDHIYAVIKGTAANNDGDRKVGYTAPSVEGQAEAIRAAHYMAGIEPETITYMEAHGTATELGDPVEIEALKLAFDTPKKRYCAIGSIKSNLGHLDSAAGAAGLIKTALALKHGLIPPSLHFQTPNPKLGLEDSPFYVVRGLSRWEPEGMPRRAGVSSLGIGGTNAHVVLEEYVDREKNENRDTNREYHLFLLSGKTAAAVERGAPRLAAYLEQHLEIPMADAAYTLAVGRGSFQYGRIAVCRDREGAVQQLLETGEEGKPPKARRRTRCGGESEAVFLFPGQGSQYVDMARGLYRKEAVFRGKMDCCFDILGALGAGEIKEILYPGANGGAGAGSGVEGAPGAVNRTEIAQPALFCIEYALAAMLMRWGIKPAAMLGHSSGEYVAACISGVMTPGDALELVTLRGRLMQAVPPGEMLSVGRPAHDLRPILENNPGISLAAVNGPRLSVLSGPAEVIRRVEEEIKKAGDKVRRLHTSHAFHSEMMEPLRKNLEASVKTIPLKPPSIPYVSNVSGDWIRAGEATDPAYWAAHLVSAVQFSRGLKLLLEGDNRVFIEVGPGRTLATFLEQQGKTGPGPGRVNRAINLVRHQREEINDQELLADALGQLWQAGIAIDWGEYYRGQKRRRVPLPGYSFEKKHFGLPNKVYRVLANLQGRELPAEEETGEEQQAREAPPGDEEEREEEYCAPRDALETNLVAVWREVLGIDKIGIYDNFFHLGGDSLTTTQLMSRVREKYPVETRVKDFFQDPTVAALASRVKKLLIQKIKHLPPGQKGMAKMEK